MATSKQKTKDPEKASDASHPPNEDFFMEFDLSLETLVGRGLWRYLPVINVDKIADIPGDYPGVMGVPFTISGHYDPEQFELLDCPNDIRIENGRKPYKRIMVRNLHPWLPETLHVTLSAKGSDASCLCPVCANAAELERGIWLDGSIGMLDFCGVAMDVAEWDDEVKGQEK